MSCERELDVMKRKYTHERLIDINLLRERNRRETMKQCNPKGLFIIEKKLEEEQHHKEIFSFL